MKHDNASNVGWIQKAMGNDKIRRWILIAGLVGIALIFLSAFSVPAGNHRHKRRPRSPLPPGNTPSSWKKACWKSSGPLPAKRTPKSW